MTLALQPEPPTIALATRKGTNIPNFQVRELSHSEAVTDQRIRQQYRIHSGVVFRCAPDPQYNCHGLTFASRRTGIFDVEILHQILAEDGYRQLNNIRDVLPGDIILYFSDAGDIEHSGIVIENNPRLLMPQILSKWGKGSEVLHPASASPYDATNLRYYRVSLP
jgi:hypothetical protein